MARNMLATHLMKAGRTFEAMRQWREAADAYHEGVKVGSSDGRGLMPLIKFLGGCPWGDALTRAGRLKEAEAAYREALADLKSLSAEIRINPCAEVPGLLAGYLGRCINASRAAQGGGGGLSGGLGGFR